jgi:hypothetical protein
MPLEQDLPIRDRDHEWLGGLALGIPSGGDQGSNNSQPYACLNPSG